MEEAVFGTLFGIFDPITMLLASCLAFFWKGRRRWPILITGGASSVLYFILMQSVSSAVMGFVAGCLQMLLLIGIGILFHRVFNRAQSRSTQSNLNTD